METEPRDEDYPKQDATVTPQPTAATSGVPVPSSEEPTEEEAS